MDSRDLSIIVNGSHASAAQAISAHFGVAGLIDFENPDPSEFQVEAFAQLTHKLAGRLIDSRIALMKEKGAANGGTTNASTQPATRQDPQDEPSKQQKGKLVYEMKKYPEYRPGETASYMNGDKPNWDVINKLTKKVVGAAITMFVEYGENKAAQASQAPAPDNDFGF